MKFEGVIFDLDGTLVNSLDDLADSMNGVLRNAGFPTHAVEAYKYFVGNGIRNLVRKTLPETMRDEDNVAQYFKQMTDTYRENCLVKSKPYDGIVELLDELKSRNLKLAVLSNKVDELTQKIISALLPDFFDIVAGVTNEDLRKPNPSGALKICKQLDISPENFLYLGDTGTDMQTANNAGMYAIGVLWGFRTKAELIANGARRIIETPPELLTLL
jgi:phosphoglycolate phosphatase